VFPSDAQARTDEFVLVRRSMQVQTIRLTEIDDQYVEHLPPDRDWEKIPLDDCIALLNPKSAPRPRSSGLLTLADGQRLPGQAMPNVRPAPEALAWNHPWLGRMDVPLKVIDSILLSADAVAPPAGERDVVLLANGDRREGLIMEFSDSIALEVTRAPGGRKQIIDIPLDLVTAVTMVASRTGPAGRRIWFDEGTVIDVQSIVVGADGLVRLSGAALTAGTQPTRVGLSQIAAILLDPKGMIPLAALTPTRVEGPATRYALPRPQALDASAPLNLSRLEFRGPLIVRYALPPNCQRFTAEASLPPDARAWGDFELVIKSDDTEIFRTRLNSENAAASINAPVTGRELTIELLAAARGPIQDRLILQRAMILMKR
jgi:hypothetical protein